MSKTRKIHNQIAARAASTASQRQQETILKYDIT
jgi:hypothetical protein